MDKLMSFKELREKTGIPPKKFAQLYNLNYRTIMNWEIGKAEPPEYALIMLSDIINEKENASLGRIYSNLRPDGATTIIYELSKDFINELDKLNEKFKKSFARKDYDMYLSQITKLENGVLPLLKPDKIHNAEDIILMVYGKNSLEYESFERCNAYIKKYKKKFKIK